MFCKVYQLTILFFLLNSAGFAIEPIYKSEDKITSPYHNQQGNYKKQAKAGFPPFPTLTKPKVTEYDFSTQQLTLPVVLVGELTYSAKLHLTTLEGSVLGFGFVLDTAEVTNNTSTSTATFTQETGLVELPSINLNNTPNASNKVSAKMILRNDLQPTTFELTELTFLN